MTVSKRKTHTIKFKHLVLQYIYEDENNPKTSYAAEKKFKSDGHMVNKQSIHGWIAKRNEIMGSDSKGQRLPGAGRKCVLEPKHEDIIIWLINEERAKGKRVNGSQVKS